MSKFRKQVANKPAYVPGKPIYELQRDYGITEVVKLASNENPLGPSPKAVEAVCGAAAQMHLYPDDYGLALKEKLSEKLKLPVEQIVLGNGGTEILKMIAEAFIDEGDEAVVSTATYGKYATEVEFLGGKAVRVPHRDYGCDLAAMLEQVNGKTKLFFVCNPNNPTGATVPERQIRWLCETLPPHVTLVLDEAYFDYAVRNPEYGDSLGLLKKRDNLVILRTFSKVAGLAAVRIGYAMTSKEIAGALNKTKLTFGTNELALAAAMAALDDEAHLNATVDLSWKSLAMMEEAFREMGLAYVPTSANFIFVDIGQDGRKAYEKLLQKGVIVRGGFLWGLDSWLRISTGTLRQTETFIRALKEVLAGGAETVSERMRGDEA